MAKTSRQPRPGDSAPDFSHLHDHEPEDSVDWPSHADEPDPETGSDEPDAVHRPGQLDKDNVLADEALSGETMDMTDQRRLEPGSKVRPSAQPSDEVDSGIDVTDPNGPGFEGGESESTGLTDVGFPAFDAVPPGHEDFPADSDTDRNRPDKPVDGDPPAEEAAVTAAAQPVVKQPVKRAAVTPSVSADGTQLTPASQDNSRQRLLLIVLASYASAVTIGFLWMWATRDSAEPHELESLPDVAPLKPNEFRYAPENAAMPRGHTLPLGDSEQYGHIEVEPLRITRGPVEFSHYASDEETRAPTEPVLKLWVRFTNRSDDQLIAPLDPVLLFTRTYQVETDTVLANQLVLPARSKSGASAAHVLDHPVTSEWDLAGQQLGYRLKPGESMETYIPLDPRADIPPSQDLLWRVHFRKGYNDQTGHGVTTMIEVPFSSRDVRSETTS